MKYFQEITLLPSYDVPLNFIWSKVYQQIHLAFVTQQDANGNMAFGISFPEYKRKEEEQRFVLGNKIRIFSEEEEGLINLNLPKWQELFTDYIHITKIRPVPTAVKEYAAYSRYHQKSSQEQKARRFAKRHNVSYEEAEKLFPLQKQKCPFPYIQLRSLTNNNPFRLFIVKKSASQPINGHFGSYGLSEKSTVPEF